MCLVYGVVQFNIHFHDLPLFLLLTLQIRGLSLIHLHITKAVVNINNVG